MKTKMTILGLVMAISFLFTQPLAATEVRVVETSGTCAGGNSCFGKIKLALEVSAGLLKVVLLQGNAIKTSKSFPKGNFEHVFENLCVGTYEVKYYPEQFPVCYKLIENIRVEDKIPFEVKIVDWINNEQVKIQPNVNGSYQYSWSFDGQNYTSGTNTSPKFRTQDKFIYAKVVDVNGCTVIQKIERLCNAGANGLDVFASIETEQVADPNKIKVIAKVKRTTGNYVNPDPSIYAISWLGQNNTVIGEGPELIISKNNPDLFSFELGKCIKLKLEYSCGAAETVKLIECGEATASVLKNYFVKDVKSYCQGIPNSASIVFDPNVGAKINAAVPNLVDPVFPRVGLQIKVDGTWISPQFKSGNENNITYSAGYYHFLSSGGTKRVSISFLGCEYLFDININTVNPTPSFVGLQTSSLSGPECKFNLLCEGRAYTKTYSAILDPESGQKSGDKCEYDLYCTLDDVLRKVGTQKYDYKKVPAFVYKYILKGELEKATAANNSNRVAFLNHEINTVEGLLQCNMVKYCPYNFKRISTDGAGVSIFPPHSYCDAEGCYHLDCFAGKSYSTCSFADVTYREPVENCCGPEGQIEMSLQELVDAYNDLIDEGQLDDFYALTPGFQNSELEGKLIEFSNSTDPRLKCATIPFCAKTYKLAKYNEAGDLNPNSPLDHVKCDEEVWAPPLSIIINLGTNGEPKVVDKSDKVKKNQLKKCRTCATHPDFLGSALNSITSIFKSIDVCPSFEPKPKKKNGTSIGRNHGKRKKPRIQAFQPGSDNVEALLKMTELLEKPNNEIETKLITHYFVDTTGIQQLKKFSTIFSEGQTSPKLLFTIDSTQHYYNYSHQIQELDHFEQAGIEHLIEDWDEWRDYYIRSSIAHKEYLITAQDTNSVWAMPLVSDSLVSVEHFSSYDSLLYVAGYYKGLLYLGGQAIDSLADHDQIGLFFMQLSKNGQLLNISLVENIDTTGGLAFSENKAGVIQVAAHAQKDSLKLNTQVQVLPQAGAVVLLQYSDNNGLQFLNAIGNSSQTIIGGLTLATGGTASTLALFGGGYAQIQNAFPSLSIGDSLTLLSFANNGNFVKARNSNAANLIPSKFALSYGAGEGMLLAVTYNQTTTLFGDTLSNEGLEDIAIMKYAVNDTLEWGELYGTSDNESVSKMMYDAQGIAYFAGEFSGTQEARMIGNYIFSDTTGLPTQRVYLSYVIDTLPSKTNAIAEIASLNNPIALSKASKPSDIIQSLGVFPNPFTNQTTVVCNTTEAGRYTLTVQNELGEVVSQLSLDLGLGQNSQVLSTQQFISGFYYLTLRNANGKVVGAQKLIKQ